MKGESGEGGVHLAAASVTLSLRELCFSQCARTGPIAKCSGAVVVFEASLRVRARVFDLRRVHSGVQYDEQQLAATSLIGGPTPTEPINNLSIRHKFKHLIDDQGSPT